MEPMEILITREQIASGVARIGQEITRDYTGQTLVLVGVLKGACLFLSDLARQIATGEWSAQQVLEAYLRRIEEVNPDLNALVVPLFDQARAQASHYRRQAAATSHGSRTTAGVLALPRWTDRRSSTSRINASRLLACSVL